MEDRRELLLARFMLAIALLFAPVRSVRIKVQTVLKEPQTPKLLAYGQDILIVGCACKMNYCREGRGLSLRDWTIPLYPRPLGTGDPKWAPAEEDCPKPSRGEEEGAEGIINKKTTNFLDAGTGASARVVFVRSNINGKLLKSYTGQPIREGQMATVFAADDGDYQEPLASVEVSFPFRQAETEWKDGEADGNPAIQDGGLVEFSNPFVSNYNCSVFEKTKEKCVKYGKLKDVFHFRAIAYGPVPDVLEDAKPVNPIAAVAENFAKLFRNECESAVSGSQKKQVGLFNFECHCPPGKKIGGSQQCLSQAEVYTENGRKFNPSDFQGLHCKCAY